MLTLENRTKIVAALRSGEFKQSRSVLHNFVNDSYCCVGVAGRVCGAFVPIRTYATGEKVGFDPYQITQLIDLNDRDGKSFPEIADVIEAFPVAQQQEAA